MPERFDYRAAFFLHHTNSLHLQRPDERHEQHHDGEDREGENRADLDEIQKAIPTGREDEHARRLKRREE